MIKSSFQRVVRTAVVLWILTACALVAAAQTVQPPTPPTGPQSFRIPRDLPDGRDLYDGARESIERGQYERALDLLDRWIQQYSGKPATRANRVDGALYWKAYTQSKQQQLADALATIADLQRRFADSRWLRDARALELEIRQAYGQTVVPDAQSDGELKVLALRGIMQVDPDRALPMIEQLLRGSTSVKVKEQALFVLSQNRLPRSRELIAEIARGADNAALQLRAVRYLGAMGGPENRQVLEEVYNSTSNVSIKRVVVRSFTATGDRTKLASIAKGEAAVELRTEAIRQLGALRATNELSDLYASEPSADIKKWIIQALSMGRAMDRLLTLAKTEKDEQLRRSAILNLGIMSADRTGETLRSLYAAETSRAIKTDIVTALFVQKNATALVQVARDEKDSEIRVEIVRRLSLMPSSKEATDYVAELLR